MPHSRAYFQHLKEYRNSRLESMPRVLALAKKAQNPKIRSMALKLYFDQRRSLEQIEKELLEGYK